GVRPVAAKQASPAPCRSRSSAGISLFPHAHEPADAVMGPSAVRRASRGQICVPTLENSHWRVTAKLRGVDAVLTEQVIERRSRYPEEFRCAREVALGHGQCLSDRLGLRTLPRNAQIDVLGVVA